MVKTITGVLLALLVALSIKPSLSATTAQTSTGAICTDFQVIYARGSGQKVNAKPNEDGYEVERDSLKSKLDFMAGGKFTFLELDGQSLGVNDLDYPAVKVVEENLKVGIVATLTAGSMGRYKDSVQGGVDLINHYLNESYKNNENTCFVLTGYSQGAQVIGDLLMQNTDASYRKKIKYVGLLGDPKYDTKGYVDLQNLPYSNVPWYRGDANFWQSGWLTARFPNYLPRVGNNMFTSGGSWCYKDDMVCSGDFLKGADAHKKYPDRATSDLALEIVNVINNPSGIIDKNKRPAETCGPAKQDIVVMLDTSPMMRRDATLFTDTPMYYGGKTGQTPPTAGEMLARTGCGDTRFAVVGYGRTQDGPPRLLLDFTKDPKAYDTLMKSLYAPNSTGIYERTQFREAALKAIEANWRPDAGKVLFAVTDIAGSGPVGPEGWRGWEDQRVTEPYLKDSLSQEVIKKVRENDAIILGLPVTHSYQGFIDSQPNIPQNHEAQRYLRLMSSQTGGYMWVKQVPNYHAYDFKYTLVDETINYATQLREKTVGSVASVRGTVGKPVTLKLNDTIGMFAAATLRSEPTNYTWYIDCSNLSKRSSGTQQTITFIPDKSGKCTGAVVIRTIGNGGGCYTCPEPFPPYMYRSIPFSIDIKPANYVPKIPGQLTNIEKVIRDSEVAYSWEKPVYAGTDEIVYVVRESDGHVLAATTAQKLVITETIRTDPLISISAAGEDGVSQAVISTAIEAIDMRTPEKLPEVIVDEPDQKNPEVPVDSRGDEEVLGSTIPVITAAVSITPTTQHTLAASLPNYEETSLRGSTDEVAVLGLEVEDRATPANNLLNTSNIATPKGEDDGKRYFIPLMTIILVFSGITSGILLQRKRRTL